MRITNFMRAFWTYLVKERLGYHRPTPPTVNDDEERREELKRVDRLEREIRFLDANSDLLRRRKN